MSRKCLECDNEMEEGDVKKDFFFCRPCTKQAFKSRFEELERIDDGCS